MLDTFETERSLLCALLLDPDQLKQTDVLASDFSDPVMKSVFKAIERLFMEGSPITPVSVESAATGLDDAFSAIQGIMMASVLASDSRAYAKRLKTLNAKITISEALDRARDSLWTGDLQSVIDNLQQDLSIVPDPEARPSVTLADAIQDLLNNKSPEAAEIPSGLPFGGIPVGSVTVIAGRSSMGKSTLAQDVVLHAASKGHSVHVFTMEDTTHVYSARAASKFSGVPLWKVVKGLYDLTEKARIDQSRSSWADRIHLDDTSGLSCEQIHRRISRHKDVNKTSLVVIDYLQLLDFKEGLNEYQGLSAAAKHLQVIAKQEQVAVIAVSQLNREAAKQDRPSMAHLRGSGRLEECASKVILIDRPALDAADDNERRELDSFGDCYVAKNKNGPLGKYMLNWNPELAQYTPGLFEGD